MKSLHLALVPVLFLATNGCSSNDTTPSGLAVDGGTPKERAVAVSVGPDFSCAVLEDGTARCWGAASGGGLGRGNDGSPGVSPLPVVELSGAKDIAVNGQASCAALKDGTVKCWGDGSIEGFGTGTMVESEIPAKVNVSHVVSLTRGVSTVCALLDDGAAECWQDVFLFAPDAPIPALEPVAIPSVHGAEQIAVGASHLCMLSADGTVQCLGSNEHGQLGTGQSYDDLNQSAQPVTVKDLSSVIQISAGDDFTCALRKDGTAACWGDNLSGQLGDRTTDDHPAPVAVKGLTGALTLAATSADHVCSIVKDGAVLCWGANSHGESGGAATDSISVPTPVNGVSDATAISSGDFDSCAIRKDGHVLCWGSDAAGELGDETDAMRAVPFDVPLTGSNPP